MKRLVTAAAAFVLLGTPAFAFNPMGEWVVADKTARVRIEPCGQALCGVIAWAEHPGTDEHNPDPAKRDRSVIGMQVLSAMKPSGENEWEGKAYNADDGKTYNAQMSMQGPDQLRVEGCVLGGLICQGEDWTRAPEATGSAAPKHHLPGRAQAR